MSSTKQHSSNFLLPKFAHAILLCGFDNDKIATGNRLRMNETTGTEEFLMKPSLLYAREECTHQCKHIRSLHAKWHPEWYFWQTLKR